MLPVLRRSKALSDSEYRDLEQSVYAASLEAGEADTTEKAIQTWTAIPRKSRREPAVVAAYAQKLIETDDMARAEALLRASIKREWSSELVRLYGLVRSTSIGDQIKRAEEWKRQYPDDATLMLTLARLYLEKNDQEKGKEYLVAAVRNGGGQEAHLELGALLEVMGERDNALKCYRRGLEHLSDSEPGPSVSSRHPTVEAVPVLGVDSELGS
jgi:HemY protein